jgi:hypothetical protein
MKQFLQSKRQRAGQAMAEMIVALVAMVVIMVGIITLGEGGHQNVASILTALSNASQGALGGTSGTLLTLDGQSSLYGPGITTLSSVFGTQPFNYPGYSINPVVDQHNLGTQIQNLNDNTAAGLGEWTTVTDARNLTPGVVLQHESSGSEGAPVLDFGEALQQLIGVDKISINNTVCWPQLTNLN